MIKHESQEFIKNPEWRRATNVLMATVPGVMHRHSSSFGAPTAIPDLFNLKERKYLDSHRSYSPKGYRRCDALQYSTRKWISPTLMEDLNQTPVLIASLQNVGQPFSDAQAFALAKYLIH
ncbi:MAG: hypothetical protein IPK57_10365 [Chitinophagaceae bacterium]|nr:hypothetical protein [Chitinophagaceae bacterium]